jgi:tagatose 1,6-diphosphate aldolase
VTETITPGRWRGLKTTSDDDHTFTILAFDQRGSYQKMLPEGTSFETAVAIKREVVFALARHVSAVLLDPVYGLPAVLDMAGGTGLLMALEKSGYTGDSTYRRVELIEGWSINKIKHMGASAVKLLVYYHPHAGTLADEIESFVATVCQECRTYDIPVFVEPVSYSLDASVRKESAEFAKTRPEVVRETARRLSKLQPDVLKLEFPVDADHDTNNSSWQVACEAVSAVCDVPWVLLSAGVDFETFAQQTKIACRAGASGFLAGRAIWKEAVTMTTQERARFLAETGVDRIRRLEEMVYNLGRPWTEFYAPMPASEDWFASYQPMPSG